MSSTARGYDKLEAARRRRAEQAAAYTTRGFRRYRWRMPLRVVCMVPLIPLLALGRAAEIAFDWLDRRLA